MPFRQENRLNQLKYNDNRYVNKVDVAVDGNSVTFNTTTPMRILWDDPKVKIQAYYGGEWHTHLEG